MAGMADREVRKANRELHHQMNKMSDLDKIDLLTKRSSELFANMKRLERDNIKNKKRADQLQKEKDTSRTDLSKQVGLKEKLEKLCRELQKENNKLKVQITEHAQVYWLAPLHTLHGSWSLTRAYLRIE